MIRFALILVGVTALIMLSVNWMLIVPPTWYYQTLFLLFSSTLGLYHFLLRTKRQQPEHFVQFYLLTLVIKFLAYGVYMLIVVLSDVEGAATNAGFFMITYLIFTGFEIGFLYHRVNR